MHAPLVRASARLTATVIAAAAVGVLAWSPAHADSNPEHFDRFGPGWPIPDSDGNAATSHIGAYGPPGTPIFGTLEWYCGDPLRKGPDTSGGYTGPKTVTHWTSSVTGRQVPDENVAYASYVVGKYGQTRVAAQAAAVDATVYEWLAGGDYGIDGDRGKERLSYPDVSPSARTLARDYLAEARKYAGPYRLTVTPKAAKTAAGTKVEVTVSVTSQLSGSKVPGVKVSLAESGKDGERGQVTTGTDGTAAWDFTADTKGTTTVRATATNLPSTKLKVLSPHDSKAQRMLLAGDTVSQTASVAVEVTAAPGGVTIHKKDPEGARLVGASFELLDPSTRQVVARGKTGSDGTLVFDGLVPGTYRLHEKDTGSRLHERVPDQDITIIEGRTAAANPITVVDPFKQAELLVKKTDRASGTPLAGAVVTINADTLTASGKHIPGKEIARLTTGKDGTAKLKLDVLRKNGTHFWAKESRPPAGYRADAEPQRFTAAPGTQVTVTLTDSKKPTPAPHQPPAPAPAELAHTGADTVWLAGLAGALLVAAGGGVWAGSRRRRHTGDSSHAQ